jgi:hypothetical protein
MLKAKQALRTPERIVLLFLQSCRPGVPVWACSQTLWSNGAGGMQTQPLPWPGSSLHSTNSFRNSPSNVCVMSESALRTAPELCRTLNFAVSIVLFRGTPITRYLYTVPYMVALPVHLGHLLAAWRWGPGMTHSKLFRITRPLFMIGYPYGAHMVPDLPLSSRSARWPALQF